MNRYRWYIGTGYIEILAESIDEARIKAGTLITAVSMGQGAFLCFSLPTTDPEVLN